MSDSVTIGTLAPVGLHKASQRLYKAALAEPPDDLRDGLRRAYAAFLRDRGLLHAYGRGAVQCVPLRGEAAQIGIDAHFLRVQSEREDLVRYSISAHCADLLSYSLSVL